MSWSEVGILDEREIDEETLLWKRDMQILDLHCD